ncbi:MAG: membrane protein insertase YidC [Anaplasmataceae bacterium]|nr:membrane protein insertase YidC [Anaplasmataceae bacterium]
MLDFRNLFFAIALSLLVLGVWGHYFPQKSEEKTEEIASTNNDINNNDINIINKTDKPSDDFHNSIILTEKSNKGEIINLDQSKRISIENNNIIASIKTTGLLFDDWMLKQYHVDVSNESDYVNLLFPFGKYQINNHPSKLKEYSISFKWIGDIDNLPGDNSSWIVANDLYNKKNITISSDEPMMFNWHNEQGVLFQVKLKVDKNYMLEVEHTVFNNSNKDITLAPGIVINRIGDGTEHEDGKSFLLHEGVISFAGDRISEFSYEDLQKKEKIIDASNSKAWLGFVDKYWLTSIVMPNARSKLTANFNNKYNAFVYNLESYGDTATIKSKDSSSYISHVYIGPKDLDLLESYKEIFDIPLFDRAVDFGVLYFITKPLFIFLNFLKSIVGNFGIAIICLTVIVKLMVLPLALKSLNSAYKMKKVQPELDLIKARYSDDKIKQNSEVLKLFKKNKVKPVAGCLPALLQIPIFFSLYKVLFITIEMRHAPFFGFLKDLSAKDPSNILTLFGLIDWSPPFALGILPILFGISMILQQKLSTSNMATKDPTQASFMKLMPYIFTFILAYFPAGLLIYWISSNSISILQQFAFNCYVKWKYKT